MRSLAAVSLLLFVSFIPLSGTPSAPASEDTLAAADLAWERGDYPAALAGYLKLLDSSDAASVLESIALRTGEL